MGLCALTKLPSDLILSESHWSGPFYRKENEASEDVWINQGRVRHGQSWAELFRPQAWIPLPPLPGFGRTAKEAKRPIAKA